MGTAVSGGNGNGVHRIGGGEMLIASRTDSALGRYRSAQGMVILAMPPILCAVCHLPRSLFVNEGGRTVCAGCSGGDSIDG